MRHTWTWDRAGLYAIVDPERCGGREPAAVAEALLRGGAIVLQLRAKVLDDAAFIALGRALRALCAAHGVPFVVNDRADLARLLDADGLHLGQDDLPLAEARRVVRSMPIGLSTHDAVQAERAAAAGADLIGFGPVFETASKARPDPVVGLEALRAVCGAVQVPVVAIGGLTVERAPEVARAGARFGAAIAALGEAEDPEAAAAAMDAALRATPPG